ncbi:MAG: large subunit ribosomal protein L21 [Candidatus Tokpelaia sp. JSC161]|jgi:large subunit ribosomal protein L21|nr:MAG: large subunit ribosomal protein L21 [Candidatus Tokpelaia sp. JSC161]
MFAVIKTGGKQYRVAVNDLIAVEKLSGNPGDFVEFREVLIIGKDANIAVGTPIVEKAFVRGEITKQTHAPKVIAFKKRRRKNSKRTRGHRQALTMVRIKELLVS